MNNKGFIITLSAIFSVGLGFFLAGLIKGDLDVTHANIPSFGLFLMSSVALVAGFMGVMTIIQKW